MMDIPQLQAFLAVAQQGSFSAAADALDLTQPAISKRIMALETELKVRLFDRIARQIQLTEAGTRLQGEAQDILQRLQQLPRRVRGGDAQVDGLLRIATSHHIGLHRLAPVLTAFRQRYPQVQLDIRFEDSEIAHQQVRQGYSELAVVTLDPNGQTDLISEPLWADPLVFISDPKHALAGKPVSLAELADHPAILPGPSTYTGQLIGDLFTRQQLRLSVAMQTNYLETIRMLVAAGYGWSALPATMLGQDVVTLNVPTEWAPARQLGLVTHPGRSASAASTALRMVLFEFADDAQESVRAG